jgi:hypothetical protein
MFQLKFHTPSDRNRGSDEVADSETWVSSPVLVNAMMVVVTLITSSLPRYPIVFRLDVPRHLVLRPLFLPLLLEVPVHIGAPTVRL